MKIFIPVTLAIISLTFFCCSEDSTETPPLDQNTKGKIVVKSNPSGAQIFLMGANTGKTTPDNIENLDQGTYNGFLYLQYYDTAYFTAQVFDNTTTTVDTTLEDSLPIVEFIFDYQISGDSVRFFFTINQDVTMDSIIVVRPIDLSGTTAIEKYSYNEELFEYRDQFGNLKKYYLPPPGLGSQYYPAIQNHNYNFHMFGHKVHGTIAEFQSHIQLGL